MLHIFLFINVFAQEKKSNVILKETEYVTITYKSTFDEYTETKTVIKGTHLYNNDLLKLKHPEYKFIGWKKNGILLKNGITVNQNIILEAKWERKLLSVSDIIQIIVVAVALLAIAIPLIIQRIWYWQEKKAEKIEEEKLKPKLKIHCDPDDIGLFTPCGRDSNGIPFAKSLKIRVLNEGLTTAKKIQLKIIKFTVLNINKTDNITLQEFNYSFLKLNWSYQDERIRLNMPYETKMDIQPQSYEDCDFLFIFPDKKFAKLGTIQSEINFEKSFSCNFQIQISGDNIQAEEFFLDISVNYEMKKIIEKCKLLKKGNIIKNVEIS